jgi:hypothetical protein
MLRLHGRDRAQFWLARRAFVVGVAVRVTFTALLT